MNKLTNTPPQKQIPVNPSDVYAGIISDFTQKMYDRKKTVLDECNVSEVEIDEEIGMMQVYWRTDRDPVETKIIVERIEAKDENGTVYEVKLDERDTDSIVEELFIELAKSTRA